MQNSEKFINAFNDIEHFLKKKLELTKEISFYSMLEKASLDDSIISRYKDDLKEYADLRNAIIHERGGGSVIAEPNEYAVKNIQRISGLIIDPPKVFPYFKRKVFTISLTDPVGKALKIMFDNSFSQLPISKGDKFYDLLTNNTISRWLGSCVDEDVFSLNDTEVNEVLKYTETPDSYFFLNRDASLAEAMEKFQYFEASGKPLDAILITQSGKPTEALMGIITPSDISKILIELSKT